jgi:hypothetical protein
MPPASFRGEGVIAGTELRAEDVSLRQLRRGGYAATVQTHLQNESERL